MEVVIELKSKERIEKEKEKEEKKRKKKEKKEHLLTGDVELIEFVIIRLFTLSFFIHGLQFQCGFAKQWDLIV